MPIESASNRIPEEALNAFLDGIRAELASPPDPAMLTEVRSIFRKRIPLHLRSYAAALLILRAAGMTRLQPPKPAEKPKAGEKVRPAEAPVRASAPSRGFAPVRVPGPISASAPRPRQESGEKPEGRRNPAPQKSAEGMVPLFVSMGKRQRLRPQELRALIGEKTGLSTEDLGRVHLFDSYSFIDVPEIDAEKIVGACEGSSLKGRPIEIKPAKKRGEQAQGKDQEA